MHAWSVRSAAVAGLSLLVCSAGANPLLPVQNLTFSDFTGFAPKTIFTAVDPVGWTGGTGLISIDAPGTATQNNQTHGNAYAVHGPFADPPPGGNFIQADGNPTFATSFNQTIAGLTVGQQYDLSFWQAAGQQLEFTGDTTEQWKVFFGNITPTVNCASNPCTVDTAGFIGQEVDTHLMNTPSGGVFPWEQVSMTFTANAASEVLSFLAWGDNGNTTNLPPTVFLAGVNTAAVPEPATLALFAAGLLGLGGSRLRRRTKGAAEV